MSVKISALPVVTSIAGADKLPLVVSATTTTSAMTWTNFLAALAAAYQPLDSDLTAIAALTTTTTGRSILTFDGDASGVRIPAVAAGATTYSMRTPAQMRSDIGAQAVNATLTSLSLTTASASGLQIVGVGDASTIGFVRVTANGTGSDIASYAVTAAAIRPYLQPPAVTKTSTGTTISPNLSTSEFYAQTALATACAIGNPTGTFSEGQRLVFRFKDDGTARALTWANKFNWGSVVVLSTTIVGNIHYVEFMYDSTRNAWDAVLSTYV